MSVQLLGSGGYFVRMGVIIGEFNRVCAQYGSALTNGFQSIWNQFINSDQAAVQTYPSQVTAYQGTNQTYCAALKAMGQLASLLQVNDNAPVVPYNYVQSVLNLKAQMIGSSDSIQQPTLGSTVTTNGLNEGNTKVFVSLNDQYGVPLITTYAETVTVTCTAQSPGSFAASLQAVGTPAVPYTANNWPQGSGCNAPFTITDPSGSSLVTDGAFANWTGTGGNTPVSWTILNGTAGTNVTKGTGGIRGGNTAQLISNSSSPAAVQLQQQISVSANTVVAVSIQAKINGTDGTAIFRMALIDGNGSILTDDSGNSLSYTRDCASQVTAAFQTFTAFFALPRQLPAATYVTYGFSVAPAATRTLTLDFAAAVVATQLYNQGPFIAAIAGSLASAVNDFYTVVFTNSLGSRSFARGLQRVFDLPNLGSTVYFPSSLSPTVPDSTITN